jgi:phosphatidylinositol 4-kinase
VKLKGKKDEDSRTNDLMDSLAGIRFSMERFENHDSGSFGESPLYSNSGTSITTKNPSTETRSQSRRKSSRPPPVVFKESFDNMQERVRSQSAHGSHPGWRLLPVLIKSNDDLRQEQLASQLIYRMASILAHEKVPVWLCAYEIVALTETGGVIEAIPDTISIDSLKRNSKDFTTLGHFFLQHFGERGSDDYADAKACFIESLAAYSMVCFLLQIKDRHNGNILVDNRGHLIHIDFGFFFLSSPGKNSGFESAPFKLTRDFVDLMDGPDSKTFRTFRELCCRTFLSLRRHCYQITLLVEMLMVGNEDLPCFRGRPEDAVSGLRERFRLDLNDRACTEYCNALIDESLENWRTRWYDRYQRYCVGVL